MDHAKYLVPDGLSDKERKRLVLVEPSTGDSPMLGSDSTRILAKRGEILLLNGKVKEGLAVFEGVRAIDPMFKANWRGLAHALKKLDRFDQAVDMLSEIAKSNPEHPEAWGGSAIGCGYGPMMAISKQPWSPTVGNSTSCLNILMPGMAWVLTYQFLDYFEEALTAFEQHTVTNPNDEYGC